MEHAELPPFLYHGTVSRFEKAIFTDGLVPSHDGGNAPETWPSRPGYVYLTDTNGFHYACSTALYYQCQYAALIVEIDTAFLNPDLLFPDDEYLAQREGAVTKENVKHADDPRFDPVKYKSAWPNSLAELGTIGYAGPIPTKAITRIARIDTNGVKNNWALQSHVLIKTRAFDKPLRAAMTQYIFDGNEEPLRDALTDAIPRSGRPDGNVDREIARIGRARHISVQSLL